MELSAKQADLFKIRSTLVSVVEDMAEEIKDRMNDLEDAHFEALGGPVVSRIDVQTLVDTVAKDVIALIEAEVESAEDAVAIDEMVAADREVQGHGV